MGRFYHNITLSAHDGELHLELLRQGARAFVSRAENSRRVVFPEGDYEFVDSMAARLSRAFCCTALAVSIHDDDVLLYSLFDCGDLVDSHNSRPGYFGEPEDEPQAGDPALLASLLNPYGSIARISDALGLVEEEEQFTFETERHERLATLLGLPKCGVGYGYEDLESGEYPSGYSAADFYLLNGRQQ